MLSNISLKLIDNIFSNLSDEHKFKLFEIFDKNLISKIQDNEYKIKLDDYYPLELYRESKYFQYDKIIIQTHVASIIYKYLIKYKKLDNVNGIKFRDRST